MANKIVGKTLFPTPSSDLKPGDLIYCRQGETIAVNGEVIKGVGIVDESVITGESAPVIREGGGNRSFVKAGSKLLSDELTIKVTSHEENHFLDQVNLEGKDSKTPNIATLEFILTSFSCLFLLTVISLKIFAKSWNLELADSLTVSILIAIFIILIPSTVSSLTSAVEGHQMDELLKKNVIAKNREALEKACDIDLVILDKTGTITIGNRVAIAIIHAEDVDKIYFAKSCLFASILDETIEGRSIVTYIKDQFGLSVSDEEVKTLTYIPFSETTRMSGVDIHDKEGKLLHQIRKGASDVIKKIIEDKGGHLQSQLEGVVQAISNQGGTPLLVSVDAKSLGCIHLKDTIKGGIKERFSTLRKWGIRTIMITGDNAETASTIALEVGVDDFIAEATPEHKLTLIRSEQKKGHFLAMIGDGREDAPALSQADVGLVMNTGSKLAKEAGNMLDLDSNPTKLLEIVHVARSYLMTLGSLTLFSFSFGVTKVLCLTSLILTKFHPHSTINLMRFSSFQSGILSLLIFNALSILILTPFAIRGLNLKLQTEDQLLIRNAFYFGLGGLVLPFFGIKLIDLFIHMMHWV